MHKSIVLLFSLTMIFSLINVSVKAEEPSTAISEKTSLLEEESLIEYSNDTYSRTGEIQPAELITRYENFANNYQKFQPTENELSVFKRLDGFELVVFFGLWCHDSQREVPKLLKLIDQSKTYFKSIKLIALNTNKVLSEKYSSNFEVTKTPSIFVLDNRKIIAKIIEKPQGLMSDDLIGQIFNAEQVEPQKSLKR